MLRKKLINDQTGSVLNVALLLLMILSLIGIAVSRTATTDVQISGNYRSQSLAFYAAEAARTYVEVNPTLYGSNNVTIGPYQGLFFPDNDNSTVVAALQAKQSYNGYVEYEGASAPPRGSGFAVGQTKAHRYKMTINGNGPSNAASQVTAGFYRIGL